MASLRSPESMYSFSRSMIYSIITIVLHMLNLHRLTARSPNNWLGLASWATHPNYDYQHTKTIIYLFIYFMYLYAFISSRLDYCNQLFVGISGWLLDKLQSLQNAAARLVTGARKFDHITPVMQQLHCMLPIQQRLMFNTSFLVFKCLCGLAPVYLVDYCKPTSANTGRSHV